MAVQLELAREHLIDRVYDTVEQRDGRDVPPELWPQLDDALRRVLEPPTVAASASEAAARAARAGYETRVVECELFEAARAPGPELRDAVAARLAGDTASWSEAAATVAAELAQNEPADRPDPDDADAISWRIPGPGGHVRHYLAMRTAQDARANSVGPAGLKRCWLYGFLLRCCEEGS